MALPLPLLPPEPQQDALPQAARPAAQQALGQALVPLPPPLLRLDVAHQPGRRPRHLWGATKHMQNLAVHMLMHI